MFYYYEIFEVICVYYMCVVEILENNGLLRAF